MVLCCLRKQHSTIAHNVLFEEEICDYCVDAGDCAEYAERYDRQRHLAGDELQQEVDREEYDPQAPVHFACAPARERHLIRHGQRDHTEHNQRGPCGEEPDAKLCQRQCVSGITGYEAGYEHASGDDGEQYHHAIYPRANAGGRWAHLHARGDRFAERVDIAAGEFVHGFATLFSSQDLLGELVCSQLLLDW